MSKFSWDDYPDFDVVAMDDDGAVYVYEGEATRSDDSECWSNEFGADIALVFIPAKQVDHGRVEPVYKPNLPPDWWFEDESVEGRTTDEERFEQLEMFHVERDQYVGAPGIEDLWVSNDTFPQDSPYNLARQAIWSHFEEFECLPDFLVGRSEVLGDFFMGIKVVDDGEA